MKLWRAIWPWLIVIAICALMIKCTYHMEFSPEADVRRAERDRQHAENKLPRKVNDAGGCEVWAFNPTGDGRWLYFTKCGSAKTDTKNEWEECRSVLVGKTTRQECTPHSMSITNTPE